MKKDERRRVVGVTIADTDRLDCDRVGTDIDRHHAADECGPLSSSDAPGLKPRPPARGPRL